MQEWNPIPAHWLRMLEGQSNLTNHLKALKELHVNKSITFWNYLCNLTKNAFLFQSNLAAHAIYEDVFIHEITWEQ